MDSLGNSALSDPDATLDDMKTNRPGSIIVNGEKWVATVLQVVDRDADGTPRTLRLLKPQESTKIEGGEAFWVVYGPEDLSKRRN